MKKIITHDGFFHADEVFAIALLYQVYGAVPVERRRTISQGEFEHPDIWILDVGQKFEPDHHNFDHHHDKDLLSTNVLVLCHLLSEDKITPDQYDELRDSFDAISEIDRNGYSQANGFQVNSLIRSFNNLEEGFGLAVQVADAYIRAAFDTVEKTEASRLIWDAGYVFPTILRVCQMYPIHWKRYKQEPFLLYPEADTWKLVSIDSEQYPIVPMEGQTFLHNSRFLAIFTDKFSGINCALRSVIEADKTEKTV